jgi:hypothetical protein
MELVKFSWKQYSVKETYSWVDEYSRILNLFNETLLKIILGLKLKFKSSVTKLYEIVLNLQEQK